MTRRYASEGLDWLFWPVWAFLGVILFAFWAVALVPALIAGLVFKRHREAAIMAVLIVAAVIVLLGYVDNALGRPLATWLFWWDTGIQP